MPKKKINDQELLALYDQGKTVTQIARELNLNKSTISRYLKRMKLNVVRENIQLAREIGAEKRNLAEELQWNIDKLRSDVDWLERRVPPANTQDYREWLRTKKDHYGEMRRTAETIGNLAFKMYQEQEVSETISIILEEISYESRETAERILRRLEARRGIRFPHLQDTGGVGASGGPG